ncbi:probable methyltransferase-like protein 24 [Paramormyrops kingsleyae]|uniref:Methyltransferase-like protein 24 n=1 Tax=Paramormyrops kingsleyae TaxID=1676925 RepID=A0A3B3SDG2_9TELE|nr:methyltransferase-like protein 24 [Paramormyrops kingsleyae]
MRAGSTGLRRLLPRLCLLIIPLLLVLQILVGVKLPGTHRDDSSQEFAFTIISIENGRSLSLPDGSVNSRNAENGGPELWDEEEGPRGASGPQGYEARKEESPRQEGARQQLELWPWAASSPSLTAEVERFVTYITTPQVQCSQVLLPGESQAESQASSWALCADGWKLPLDQPRSCVSYSFSMDQKDRAFVEKMLWAGCEVHQFDPSPRRESASGQVQQHRIWIDWRGPRGGVQNRPGHGLPRRLSAIMDALGHREVHFLNADLESAEWRVLESWALDGTLGRIQQLLLTVHLQWAGFEVAGSDTEVVRFWYSAIRGLGAAGFSLLHSATGTGNTILRHPLPKVHSTYTLTWVKTEGVLGSD